MNTNIRVLRIVHLSVLRIVRPKSGFHRCSGCFLKNDFLLNLNYGNFLKNDFLLNFCSSLKNDYSGYPNSSLIQKTAKRGRTSWKYLNSCRTFRSGCIYFLSLRIRTFLNNSFLAGSCGKNCSDKPVGGNFWRPLYRSLQNVNLYRISL